MKHSALLSIAAATLCALTVLPGPVQAATIAITYSYAGTQAAPPVMSGTILTAGHLLSGSILFGNAALNAALDPITGQDHDTIDLTTGILTGSVSYLFANGEKLFANQIAVPTGAITSAQTLTFTGGTGEFAGATGSASGTGSLTSTGYMVSGSGVINTSAAVPEPRSATLLFAGLALLMAGWRRTTAKTAASEFRRRL